MTQSPQEVCTGGMERDEGGEESKGGLEQEQEVRHLHGLGCAAQAAVVPSPDPPGCSCAGRLSTASWLGCQSGVAMT